MYYEINVSKNGRHYFATHERSIGTENKCRELVAKFRAAFPESQGYSVTASRYEHRGIRLDV